MSEMLSVTAIQTGTVIDHITAGQALSIVNVLGLKQTTQQITIGLNLPSKRMGRKDLIKIETRILTNQEANNVVVFAPHATINVIQKFKVIKKIKTHLPKTMHTYFICPNLTCVTHCEKIDSLFYIVEQSKKIKLLCHYCESQFDRDQVSVNI